MADRIDVFWHPDVLRHDGGEAEFDTAPSGLLAVTEPFVEGPGRVRNMRSILERGPLAPQLDWHPGRHATDDEILTFHTAEHLADLEAAARAGGRWYTRTTRLGADSMPAVRAAAGTALAAMAHIMDGAGRLAYALVRPPGHHAAPGTVDGYCFVNNLALAAELALARGAGRVAVIDWDVHHGNGTQAGFYDRAEVLTVSLHMDHGAWGPSHPETGQADEIGSGPGRGFNLNVPLPMGTGDTGYDKAMRELVVPAVDAFAPGVVIVANGQDANQFDPNGRQLLSMAGFRRLGGQVRELAARHAGGRLLLVQEGGYQASYAAYCLAATLEGVLGTGPLIEDRLAFYPEAPGHADAAIAATAATRARLLSAG